jgi:tetratricopeptide (TPR) repeat protein
MERSVAEGTCAALERVAAAYQGHLLDGFVVGEAPFDEWLQTQRARVCEVALPALEKLAGLQLDAGMVERAIETAHQSLRLEPLRERTHRLLMRLYARDGRRTDAIRQYERCVAVLKSELDVEPEEATSELYRKIVDSTDSAAPWRPSRLSETHAKAQTHAILSLDAFRSCDFHKGIEHGLEAVSDLDPSSNDSARAWMHLGMNYLSLGDCKRALQALGQGYAIAEKACFAPLQSQILSIIGLSHNARWAPDLAFTACARALAVAPDRTCAVLANYAIARVWASQGKAWDETCSTAVAVLEQALRDANTFVDPPVGGRPWTAYVKDALAGVHTARGDILRAKSRAHEALTEFRSSEARLGVGYALRTLALCARSTGEYVEARERTSEAVGVFHSIGARMDVAWTLLGFVLAAQASGDLETASAYAERARRLFCELELENAAAFAEKITDALATLRRTARAPAPQPYRDAP